MAKKDYDKKYIKEHCKFVSIILNKDKDADILNYLNGLGNGKKGEFIKRAIRNEMGK